MLVDGIHQILDVIVGRPSRQALIDHCLSFSVVNGDREVSRIVNGSNIGVIVITVVAVSAVVDIEADGGCSGSALTMRDAGDKTEQRQHGADAARDEKLRQLKERVRGYRP